MREYPRLTSALRAFGNVSSTENASNTDGWIQDLARRKALALEKQRERSLPWNTLVTMIKKNTDASKTEVSSVITQLLSVAKSIGET